MVLKPAQGFHDLTWGMAQFIKMPATSLSAMYTPTQKGSSPEASPFPAGSNTGGELSLVPPLSTKGRPDQFQRTYGMLHCLQMSALGQGIMSPKKVRGMLGVHCHITPYLALGLPTLATFQLTFCHKSVCCLQ